MEEICYIVPIKYVPQFHNHELIVQIQNIHELAQLLESNIQLNIRYFQIINIHENWKNILQYTGPVPLDVIIQHPETEYSLLYRYTEFGQIRANISCKLGCFKAIKLAAALHFPVRLDMNHAPNIPWNEWQQIFHFYTTNPCVTEPIEPFHSLLHAQYQNISINLWDILEENPKYIQIINDQGQIKTPPHSIIDSECQQCPYFSTCQAYWKKNSASCTMQPLFTLIQETASQLHQDHQQYNAGDKL
ncbi:MAG TPA: hypothetical protein P5543_04055 [Planctomycetota bacterium]|nr:hypothetical protein [Planctomycetota bacterium]HRU51347.1 hypothetical protein [Planctomycetota bacterium]